MLPPFSEENKNERNDIQTNELMNQQDMLVQI